MARENSKYLAKRQAVDRFATILLAVFVVLAIVTSVVAFFWAKNVFASWNVTKVGEQVPLPGSSNNANSGKNNNQLPSLPTNAPTGPLQTATGGPAPQAWDGKTRVTLLVMGLDYRACDAADNFSSCDTSSAARTDSMMLVTVDPASKTAGMLSIPRDLWVQVPGYGYYKINTAYFLGEANKVPGGGPALAMETVQEVLGVPIQYYAQIDFNAFVKFIDSMGGLDMHIRKEITVDPIGPGNTRKLEVGVQTLDGATVLAYARNRYTEGGDFDRAERQQEVIMAIRKQILQFNMLPTLVTKSPELYQELQSGIRTNMTLTQVVQLAWLMQQIPDGNIKKEVIGPPKDITYSTSPDGLAIEIPVPDQIRLKRDEIFTTGGPVGPAAVANDPTQLIKAEAAKVAVNNGSSEDGLATKTADYLRNKGVNVISEGNASQAYTQSTIIDYTGKPYTIKMLAEMLGIDNTRVLSRYDPTSQVDVEIILGSTFAKDNPLSK